MIGLSWRRVMLSGMLATACVAPPSVDVDGPRVVDSNLPLPRNLEMPVWPTLRVELTEPLDEDTVHAGSVVLIEWEDTGSCTTTPLCTEGTCERGRCQEDPLTSGDLSAIARGEGHEQGIPLALEMEATESGATLWVTPLRPLREFSRFSLLLGEAIRDHDGAPLESELGLQSSWRRDFVTRGRGSSGPEPVLQSPLSGQTQVPINVEWIDTSFELPVAVGEGALDLWAMSGGRVALEGGVPCPGWIPGTCLRWPVSELPASDRFAPMPALDESNSLRDVHGRPAAPSFETSWFGTAAFADDTPPELSELEVHARAGCVHARLFSEEPITVELEVVGSTLTAAGMHTLELAVPVSLMGIGPGDVIEWTIRARDLAGNAATMGSSLVLDSSFGDGATAMRITEVLANPAGTEPDQEFVELLALVDVEDASDLRLSDLAWEDIQLELASGGQAPGDPLPPLSLHAGQLAIAVGSKFDPASTEDPAPDPTVTWLVVDASLATSGLKNVGEPLTLYRADPPSLIASYGNHLDTGSNAFQGRSVSSVDPSGCDVAANWRPHPFGTSTPGAIP